MELAIFHPWLKERGGAEKLVLSYVENSDHNITVFTLFFDEEKTFDGFENVNVREIGDRKPPEGWIDSFLRFLVGNAVMQIPLDDYDALLLSETGMIAPAAIRNADIPVFAYVHTPLRAALPEFKSSYRSELHLAMWPAFEFGIAFNNVLETLGWKNIQYAFANSELTKKRMISKHLIEGEKIEVTNPGADLVEEQEGEYENYFFYPSRFRRYKRQHLAIEAFKEADLDNFKLVLAGSGQEDEYIEELRDMADENIEIRTDVPEEEWNELYRNCRSILFLPEAEDWGIVPLEAGMFGKPTIAVDEGSPSETIKDGETGYLTSSDPSEIAEKMERLAGDSDEAERMGENARELAKNFTWQNFSKKLDSRLEDLI